MATLSNSGKRHDETTTERPQPPWTRPDASDQPTSDPPLSLNMTTMPVEPRGGPGLEVTVRAVHPRDLFALARVRTIVRLNQPEANLQPLRATAMVVAAIRPRRRPRPRVFVASAGSRLVGFAQFEPVAPDRRWHLNTLGAATGVYDAGPVWDELIGQATVVAGLSGVKRLYARAPIDAPVAELLRGQGFAAYAAETVLVANDVPPRPIQQRLRSQEQSDTWAIHQLYNAAVPRQVQYAEAFTSHRWDVNRRFGGVPAAGWIIDEGHHVIGYARTSSREGRHVVEVVYHPERVDVLDDLLDGVLARLAEQRARRVFCVVRQYQAEALTAWRARGFVPVLDQELAVKYTAAIVRAPVVTVPIRGEVRERVPKRVPTFLHGRPGDESVR